MLDPPPQDRVSVGTQTARDSTTRSGVKHSKGCLLAFLLGWLFRIPVFIQKSISRYFMRMN